MSISVITPDRVMWARKYSLERHESEAVPVDADVNTSGESWLQTGTWHMRVGAMFMAGTAGPYCVYPPGPPPGAVAYRLHELIVSYRLAPEASGDGSLIIRYATDFSSGAYLLLSQLDFDEAREDPGTRHIVIPCHGLISRSDYPMVTIQYSNIYGTVSWIAEEVYK